MFQVSSDIERRITFSHLQYLPLADQAFSGLQCNADLLIYQPAKKGKLQSNRITQIQLYLSEFLVCSISLCKLSMAPLCLFLKSEMSDWTELNKSSLSTMAAMLEAVLLNSCL